MIGSLQRQLEIATGRLAESKPNGIGRKTVTAKGSVRARAKEIERGETRRAHASEEALTPNSLPPPV
jgi:hypothetical protein